MDQSDVIKYDGTQSNCKLVFETNTQEHCTDFQFTQFYLNNTDEDVYVIHRNNLPVYFKKATGHFAGAQDFVIRTTYKFRSSARIIDTINILHKFKNHFHLKQPDLDLMIEALVTAYNSDRNIQVCHVSLDRCISARDIKRNSAMYIEDCDLLITDHRSFGLYPHPYSAEGQVRSDYKKIVQDKKISGIFVELVDNEQVVKNRFMSIGNKIVQIPSTVDGTKESGVYYTRAEYDPLDEVHLHPEYLTFEEAEKSIGLFKTQDEAITNGNPELVHKQQMKEKEIQLENLRIANAGLKEEIDRNKTIRTDEFEERGLIRKQHFEDRNYDRKDQSEFFKLAGVVVATGLGIYVAMSKTQNKR